MYSTHTYIIWHLPLPPLLLAQDLSRKQYKCTHHYSEIHEEHTPTEECNFSMHSTLLSALAHTPTPLDILQHSMCTDCIYVDSLGVYIQHFCMCVVCMCSTYRAATYFKLYRGQGQQARTCLTRIYV